MIGEAGFEVLEAANADEAILLLEAWRDMTGVFTDIEMAGSMDGLKLGSVASRFYGHHLRVDPASSVNEIERMIRAGDVCQGNCDLSRITVPGSGGQRGHVFRCQAKS